MVRPFRALSIFLIYNMKWLYRVISGINRNNAMSCNIGLTITILNVTGRDQYQTQCF